MRARAMLAWVVAGLGAAQWTCAEDPRPVGELSETVRALELQGWISEDTVISIDPRTLEERQRVSRRDMSPDTLADGTVVYQLSEYLPVYAGCDTALDAAICTQNALNDFVRRRLRYPGWARARGLEGTAVAAFTIAPDGRVVDLAVERSMGDDLDRLVLGAVRDMPRWYPGFHDGEPVAVRYRLPVQFSVD